jgi:hypothetical protein
VLSGTSIRDALDLVNPLPKRLMPGVVSLPHGYGHRGEGIALRVASERAGASANDLTDPAEIDPLSGNAVLNGVPVDVEPAEMPAPKTRAARRSRA